MSYDGINVGDIISLNELKNGPKRNVEIYNRSLIRLSTGEIDYLSNHIGAGGGIPNPDPGTLQDGEMIRYDLASGKMEGSGDINTDLVVNFGTKTVQSGTGTFRLGEAVDMSSGGENVIFTNLADNNRFHPVWVDQQTNEAFTRITVGALQEFIQESSKADILINPSWTSNPIVDWRVITLTVESDTTITNAIFNVTKNGNDFYSAQMGTITANIETVVDLTAVGNVPVDAFQAGTYVVSVTSPDGDVRLKGSIANSLPFFKVGYFEFIDKITDPDLRIQRRSSIGGDITQQGYQASVADGSIEDQGWTNVSTGSAIIASIIDPDDGLRTLRMFDNSNTALAAMDRPLTAQDFQDLFDNGGQINLLVRPVTGTVDISMVEGLGFSAANDPGWKTGDGRWAIFVGVNFNGHPIIEFEGGTPQVFTGQIGDYFNCVIVVKPGTMVSDCYINGVFIETVDFAANASPSTFDDKFRMESGSTAEFGREAYIRETLLTIFGVGEQIEPTKEEIEANEIITFPDNVSRDWIVKFPDDDVERGSNISVSLSNLGTTTLTRFGSDVTFNGQESMQIQGPGKLEITQVNVDDAAPDKVYQVILLGGATEINQINPIEYVLASPGLTVEEREKIEDAVLNADDDTTPMQFVIDEDNMISDSDTKVPTQQSVKAYVDNNVIASLNYKGGYDAANNIPDLDVSPSGVIIGDFYTVTSSGLFFTKQVEIGDAIIAEVDNATTEADWTVLNRNLDAATIKILYESNPDTNAFTDAKQTKLAGIEAGAEVNNISDVDATDLTDGGDTTLHFHSSDRDRSNHTGTQLASTISDFDTEVSNNTDVTANTAKITNATHTGEVTGSGALTVDSTAISNKTLITGASGQEVLINDAGTLKKVNAADFLVGGGVSGFTLHFDANDAIYNINHRATANSRNGHPIIKFSDADDDGVTFGDTMPNSYNAETITVDIDWVAETATSGAVSWFVSFERNAPNDNDIDSDSYAAAKSGTSTTNATNGKITRTSITFTQAEADGVTANDHFRIKLIRDPADVGDTMSGDAELLKISIRV